jgi:hypothetical protein
MWEPARKVRFELPEDRGPTFYTWHGMPIPRRGYRWAWIQEDFWAVDRQSGLQTFRGRRIDRLNEPEIEADEGYTPEQWFKDQFKK